MEGTNFNFNARSYNFDTPKSGVLHEKHAVATWYWILRDQLFLHPHRVPLCEHTSWVS